ncbi:alpha/beta hydrolase [Devosia sp.]|uniref:alpha/beta fold hydrolase n=1 Tax=Devosia sp. TaxID=1871048 RepID=UPI003266ECFC
MPTPSKSGYAPVNGVEVYYAVFGSGKPLVLLHGGLGDMTMFGPVLDALAAGRQVIGVDLQGHGHTLPFDRPMTAKAMATDVAELIKYLGLEQPDVLGYSMGALIAMRLAIDHPEAVGRLVLASVPYAFSGWHDFNQQGMKSISGAMAESMKQTPMYQAYASVAPDVNNWPVLLDKMGKFVGADYDYSAEVAAIKSPTLLVFADWDSVRTAHAAHFFELLGGGHTDGGWGGMNMNANRLAVLPGATHYDIFINPTLATTAIAFLDHQPQPAS